jgi:hypothetical protein
MYLRGACRSSSRSLIRSAEGVLESYLEKSRSRPTRKPFKIGRKIRHRNEECILCQTCPVHVAQAQSRFLSAAAFWRFREVSAGPSPEQRTSKADCQTRTPSVGIEREPGLCIEPASFHSNFTGFRSTVSKRLLQNGGRLKSVAKGSPYARANKMDVVTLSQRRFKRYPYVDEV